VNLTKSTFFFSFATRLTAKQLYFQTYDDVCSVLLFLCSLNSAFESLEYNPKCRKLKSEFPDYELVRVSIAGLKVLIS
jgi:hypothetical protein